MGEKRDEMAEIYLEKYISETTDLTKMEKRIEKLNRLYARENFRIDEHGNLVITEGNQRICNFFVFPTHKLYYDDGNNVEIDGVGIIAYAKISDDKYRSVHLNLKFNQIESGDWLKSEFLDTDYDLIRTAQYSYLRSALKIATRRIGSNNVKIFDEMDEDWIEDEDAERYLSEYRLFTERRRYLNDNKRSLSLEKDVTYFIEAVAAYTKEKPISLHGSEPDDEEENIGWQNESNYFLWAKKMWSWIDKKLNTDKDELTFDKNTIMNYLAEHEIIKYDEEKNRIRYEIFETVYPKYKKRFIKIDKVKMHEFMNMNKD